MTISGEEMGTPLLLADAIMAVDLFCCLLPVTMFC